MAAVSPSKRQISVSPWMIVAMTLVVVLVAGAGTVTALYYTGYIGADQTVAGATPAASAAEDSPSEADKPPPIYLALDPPLVVNFNHQGRVGYLQAGLQLMARQQSVIDAAQHNMPMIRNSLLMLLGTQSYEELSSYKGKEQLRQKTLAEVNRILDQVGAPGHIEAVYFTAFVMQ